jgi:hypothetical protein
MLLSARTTDGRDVIRLYKELQSSGSGDSGLQDRNKEQILAGTLDAASEELIERVFWLGETRRERSGSFRSSSFPIAYEIFLKTWGDVLRFPISPKVLHPAPHIFGALWVFRPSQPTTERQSEVMRDIRLSVESEIESNKGYLIQRKSKL